METTTEPTTTPEMPRTAGENPAPGHSPDQVRNQIAALIGNIEKAIVGKHEAIKLVVAGLIGRGHILIEDVPGVGKTTLARALAKSIDCTFCRIQFTPDLLPSDIVGVNIYEPQKAAFKFHPGPLFGHVILADEINRTAPRTQAALLEAMNEFQVSVDGVTHVLPKPFIVLATENPVEYAGTFPLPEAQMDRFLLRVIIGYPDRDSELAMLKEQQVNHPVEDLEPVVTAAEVDRLQTYVRNVKIQDELRLYIIELANRTREHRNLVLGVSPRGCKMLQRAAQALAVVEGRDYVLPDDIKRMAVSVLAHRIVTKSRDVAGNSKDAEAILADILEDLPVPI